MAGTSDHLISEQRSRASLFQIVAVLTVLLAASIAAHADDVQVLKSQLSKLARDARYPEAMVIAKQLVDKAVADGKHDSRDYAEAISWMGFLHQGQGEITAAGKLFSEAVDVYSRILPPTIPILRRASTISDFTTRRPAIIRKRKTFIDAHSISASASFRKTIRQSPTHSTTSPSSSNRKSNGTRSCRFLIALSR